MKTKLHYVLTIAMLLCVFSVLAQDDTWNKVNQIEHTQDFKALNLLESKTHLFKLDTSGFKQLVSSAPLRQAQTKTSGKIISVPGLNGILESFRVYEAPVFTPELAAKYPNIKSYVGYSTKDAKIRLRMSVSPQGIQTMISYPDKPTVFMQPVTKGLNTYVVYQKNSKKTTLDRFSCTTMAALSTSPKKSSNHNKNEGGANNQTLQKFRIAISATGEYTAYHGGTVAGALAAINATLTRVNAVFETDMAVSFELVDAPQLIYTDALTDPYSDANIGTESNGLDGWSLQVQNTLTSVIGNAAYDIGHLFGASGGGGNAGCIGCVCVDDDPLNTNDRNKGSAYTSPSDNRPEGDTFDIDYVVHEIGHQMGASHTFAFESEGTGVNSEPGSGTTIMAYAGITGPNNVSLNSDDYFHYHSIKQILDNLATKTCQTSQPILNNPPIANAGSNYSIPKGTAYVLKGAATDLDSGDMLTYTWEQIDSGTTNYLNFGPNLNSGAMNRSLPPSASPNRYIPKLTSVLDGNTIQTNPTLGSDWETVSTVPRTLNWALTVRDRSPALPSGGQTSYDTMQITVEDVTPFSIVNPISWTQGVTETINWNVGETNNSPINCQNVNIVLSTNGGTTFDTLIASNIPNTGSYTFMVPAITNTSMARLLIEAADNIFYDVSDFDFSISTNPDFFIANETLEPIDCKETTAYFTFEYVAANGFSENTSFSASGIPAGATVTFLPENLSTSGLVTMTISNLEGVAQNDYPITITGTPAVGSPKTRNVLFPFYNQICPSVANTDYATSTTLVEFNTINNSSLKPSGYSDYTAISTDVNRGSAYNLTVNTNTDGNFGTNTTVWIDWNQDCDFDDAGETYNLGTTFNELDGQTSNSPLSITIPTDAVLGNTTMRVTTKFNDGTSPRSCENGFDGEVEDYTLTVQASKAIEEFGFDNFVVFPNPNKGQFYIKLNSSLSSNIVVEIFSLTGQLIYKKTFQDGGDFKEEIALNYPQSGMYILNVSDNKRKSTKKLIFK